MRYTIYTRSVNIADEKVYQEEIDCDMLQFDPHSKFLICIKTGTIALPQGAVGEPWKFGTFSYMFNNEYLVEFRLSSVNRALSN